MKKLGLVTAAFAAGAMSFAVNLAEGAPLSLRADQSPTPTLNSKLVSKQTDHAEKASADSKAKAGSSRKAKAKAKARTAKKASSHKTKVASHKTKSKAKAASHETKVSKASASTKKPARSRKAKENRTDIDLTKTASVSRKETPAPAAASGASSTPYSAIIARYASSYGVSVSLANAVISVESNYQPNVTGSAGEVGLMQIKPSTARMLGYTGSVEGLYDPETNIKYGMKYLAMAQDVGDGTTCGTILKYNAGHAATRMNPVSSAYCSKVKIQLATLGAPA
jgi:soluble lytic murein transglycosylase-like protein